MNSFRLLCKWFIDSRWCWRILELMSTCFQLTQFERLLLLQPHWRKLLSMTFSRLHADWSTDFRWLYYRPVCYSRFKNAVLSPDDLIHMHVYVQVAPHPTINITKATTPLICETEPSEITKWLRSCSDCLLTGII